MHVYLCVPEHVGLMNSMNSVCKNKLNNYFVYSIDYGFTLIEQNQVGTHICNIYASANNMAIYIPHLHMNTIKFKLELFNKPNFTINSLTLCHKL